MGPQGATRTTSKTAPGRTVVGREVAVALAWTALAVFGSAAYFALALLATVVFQTRTEMRAGFAGLRTEMHDGFAEVRGEIRELRDRLTAAGA